MALQTLVSSSEAWKDVIPTRIDAQCAYCNTTVAMERIGPVVEHALDRYGRRRDIGLHSTYVCPRESCLMPSLAFFTGTWEGSYQVIIDGPRLIPRGQPRPMDGLPEAIQEDRREAWSCLYGGDVRAAIIMGRAAIQRAVRSLNAQGAGLKAEINDLHQKHVITAFLKEWADEVRIAG